MIQFPENFLWGSAISAHQVEGNNVNNDWWKDELSNVFKEPSQDACKHYDLYEQDFDLAKSLNHKALRLSIEWSRIQPRRQEFNEAELRHYIKVIKALKVRAIEPIITLHHFTNPVWFNEMGGWQGTLAPHLFSQFVTKIAEVLCSDVKYWVTINEPLVYIYFGYFTGIWPPHKNGFSNALRACRGLMHSHIRAYQAIHNIYKKNNLLKPCVSIAKNVRYFSACRKGFKEWLAVNLRDRFFNFYFLEALYKHKALDFIGVNYYTREQVTVSGQGIRNILFETCQDEHQDTQKNSLGWDIYPEGLYEILLRLKKFKLPVFILENGICTNDDNQRWEFIRAHLKCLHKSMENGINCLGYLYWSLLDNYEWDKGFGPKFGLIEVDYNNFKRTIRESAAKYAEVCRTGRLQE